MRRTTKIGERSPLFLKTAHCRCELVDSIHDVMTRALLQEHEGSCDGLIALYFCGVQVFLSGWEATAPAYVQLYRCINRLHSAMPYLSSTDLTQCARLIARVPYYMRLRLIFMLSTT